MQVFDAITTRHSAARLGPPGPSPEELERLLQAAVHAPDHGRLKPWRFLALQGAQRETFIAAAARSKRLKNPDFSDEQIDSEKQKIARSPCIVVVGCVVNRAVAKVPEIEQIAAVAAAVENLFLAARDLGFGVMWKTGPAAYDPEVKRTVGLNADDHIVAI